MLFKTPQIFYDAPGGEGGNATQAGGQGKSTNTADAAGGKGKDADDQDSGDDKKFTQADIDRIVQERLAREQAKSEKAAEKAKKEAELARLAENQEFQELAQKRQERVVELEEQVADYDELQERAKKYEKALTGYRDALIKGVPENVRSLLDGLDIADQLQWLSDNAKQFSGDKTPLPSTPSQNGTNGLTADEKRRRAFTPRL